MNIPAAMDQAKAHYAAGRHTDAEAIFRKVLAADANHADAWHCLGVLACAHGHGEAGLGMIRRAIALSPVQPLFYSNLGEILRRAGMMEHAIAACEQALRLRPDAPYALYNLSLAQREVGLLDEALANGRKAATLIDDDGGAAHSALLVTMHYVAGVSRDEMFAEHRAWAERHAKPMAALIRPHENTRDPERRLRVGYVSGDFRQHSVAYFIRPILDHHEPAAVELFCYSSTDRPDTATAELQALVPNWRDVAAMSDEQFIEQIRRDAIDILVDLSGHTGGGRLRSFAAQPAPVQATYLGYPDTTGLATMQWRITDAVADPPPDADRYCTERLMRLPHGFLTYAPPADAPEVGEVFSDAARPVTFVSFNAFQKITPAMIALWARILRELPGSRLMLKAFALEAEEPRRRTIDAFAGHGVQSDRLDLLGRAATVADHLALYQRADVALDTFPYNGTTTTCEALWMGVPVVTLAGGTHASRVGASLLTTVGLTELIAGDETAYIRAAVELARDVDRLRAMRRDLRERLRRSHLLDAVRFVAHLEQAYRVMWREWCFSRGTAASPVQP